MGMKDLFYEANHLEGDTNLVAIMKAIIDNEGYASMQRYLCDLIMGIKC